MTVRYGSQSVRMSVPSEPTAHRESLKPLILNGALSAVRVKALKQGIGFSAPQRIQLSTNKPQLMLGETPCTDLETTQSGILF